MEEKVRFIIALQLRTICAGYLHQPVTNLNLPFHFLPSLLELNTSLFTRHANEQHYSILLTCIALACVTANKFYKQGNNLLTQKISANYLRLYISIFDTKTLNIRLTNKNLNQ